MTAAAIALTALSAVHFPVSTHDAVAQALVDRGLFCYYAYDDGDSAAAFAAAAARDPDLAMAHWGEALADGPDLNTPMTAQRFAAASEAARAAAALERHAGPSERAYIEAMARRYAGTYADWAGDDAAYRAAMTQIAAQVAGRAGDDARDLAAEALLEHGGLDWAGDAPLAEDSRRALALVDAVLAADPADPMANHLCVHLYDDAPVRAPAAPCARRLDSASLPPQAEHLAHMPAHYWIETGNYAAALASSERSYRLFERLEAIAARSTEHDRYLAHDVYVGYSAAMMLGSYADARTWTQRMDAAVESPYDALTALRFGRFADARARAAGSSPGSLATGGYAALMLHDVPAARAAARRLEASQARESVAALFLARLAETDGRYADAAAWIERAAAQEAGAFSGELIPLLPAAEARAGLALRRGEYAAAAAAYREALQRFPGDARAAFGLSRALRALGEEQEAARARAQFSSLWGERPIPSFAL